MKSVCLLFLGVIIFSTNQVEGLDIGTISKSGANVKVNMDLSGLQYSQTGASRIFHDTLISDLERSGWFVVVGSGNGVVSVSGRCVTSGASLIISCEVINRNTKNKYLSKRFEGTVVSAGRLAHKVADEIIFAVKNVQGISSTRIAMIGSVNGKKDVYVCDADGSHLERITDGKAVCMSPSWGSGGHSFIYFTSYRSGYPDIYMVNLEAVRHVAVRVAAYPGLNTGADISPDGKSMVLTLSKDGNPELYIRNLRSGRLTRLTGTRNASEASPSWSPDGRKIVFVSDSSGSPHLYVMDIKTRKSARITFRGTENVAPDWGPNGLITYSSRRGGRYQICVIDPSTRREIQYTSDYVDHEDPSWAPDSRHIVYSRTQGYQSEVYVLDTKGDPPVRLLAVHGDWFCPSWSYK